MLAIKRKKWMENRVITSGIVVAVGFFGTAGLLLAIEGDSPSSTSDVKGVTDRKDSESSDTKTIPDSRENSNTANSQDESAKGANSSSGMLNAPSNSQNTDMSASDSSAYLEPRVKSSNGSAVGGTAEADNSADRDGTSTEAEKTVDTSVPEIDNPLQ